MNFIRFLKKIIPNSLLFKPWFSRIAAIVRLRKRKLLCFEVHITDHCNLNCVGCMHFSCIAPDIPSSYLDVEKFERDCARLSSLSGGEVERIEMLGGEPLLHPRCSDILAIARKYFPKGEINILTNGVLLTKMGSEFYNSIKENHITLQITKYPVKLDFSAIEALAEKYCVQPQYFEKTDKEIKRMLKVPFDMDGKQNPEKMFNICFRSNVCIQLYDGKLFTCMTIPYVKFFNDKFGTNLEVTERDYIDIYKAESVEQINEFLCKPVPFCRYCDMANTESEIDWAVTKGRIAEWTKVKSNDVDNAK